MTVKLQRMYDNDPTFFATATNYVKVHVCYEFFFISKDKI